MQTDLRWLQEIKFARPTAAFPINSHTLDFFIRPDLFMTDCL